MTILILGATGQIGKALVKYFLMQNLRVLAPVRNEQKRAELLEYLRESGLDNAATLELIDGDLYSASGAEKLFTDLTLRNIQVDLVIASLGKFEQMPKLINLDEKTWKQFIDANLTAHFRAAKHSLQLLNEQVGGRYIVLNGEKSLEPESGTAAISIADAAQEMLVRSLITEQENPNLFIQSLVIMNAVDLHKSEPNHIPAEWVGRFIQEEMLPELNQRNWEFRLTNQTYLN